MAGAQQVQEYLQTHKIGNLFEDLMAKVVSDMPDDPVVYIIQTLERRATRLGSKSIMRRSMGDLAHMRSTIPDKAATWAGGVAVAKERPYTKPWQTNTKRQVKKKLSETDPAGRRPKTAPERPDWDGKVKDANTNLDDFWGESDVISKPQRRGRSPTRARAGWADEAEDEELLYRSQGYTGPRRLHDADPLSGEFSLSRDMETRVSRTPQTLSSGRVRGPASDAQRHRQELGRLVQASQRHSDSGIEEDQDGEADDAVELLEDADDLRSEGVMTKSSGRRAKPVRRSGRGEEPQVRVSICARCAQVMNGPAPSDPARGTGYGELPDFEVDSDREFPESRPQSSARLTDDEFESVSQVSGPRKPVWQNEDSDNEALSARKGRHMFTSSGVPSKGRPMFSPEPAEASRRSTLKASGVYQSVETATSSRSLRGHSAFNRTWTEGQSEDEPKQKPVDKEESVEKETEDAYTPAPFSTRYLYVSKSYEAQMDQESPVSGKGVTFRADDTETPDAASATHDRRQEDDEDGGSTTLSLRGTGWGAPSTDVDSDFTVPPARVSRARGKGRQYQGQY